MKKNVAKKTSSVAKKTIAEKPAIQFTVDIPDGDLENLVKLNAAKVFTNTAKELMAAKSYLPLPQFMADSLSSFAETCDSVGSILDTIQKEFCKNTKTATPSKKVTKHSKGIAPTPAEKKPVKLSNLEKSRIKELRAKGLTIKAVAKELHRSDRPVAAYVKVIEKKGKKN